MTVKEFKHDYFSFKGRLNRKPFLMRLMMLGAISIFFVLIVINAEPHLKEDPAHFATNVRKSLVFWVYYIPLIIASISLGVRRLHDLNLSGWWMLLGSGALLSTVNTGNTAIDLAAAILFYIAQLFNLFLIFFRGTKGPNRFGEDPVPQPVKEPKKNAAPKPRHAKKLPKQKNAPTKNWNAKLPKRIPTGTNTTAMTPCRRPKPNAKPKKQRQKLKTAPKTKKANNCTKNPAKSGIFILCVFCFKLLYKFGAATPYQASTSTPVSVTRTVFSHWADMLPPCV